MRNKINTFCAALMFISMGAVSQAQFGGLKSMLPGGDGAAESGPAVNIGALNEQLDKSVLEVGLARQQLIEAQLKLLEALDLKTEADEILSASDIALEGGVSAKSVDDVEKSTQVSAKLQEAAAAKMAETVQLTEDQKVLFTEGKVKFGAGLLAEAAQIAGIVALAGQVAEDVEKVKSNPLNAPKALALAASTAKLASLVPGDVKAMYETWGLIRKVGADNQIEVEEIDISKYMGGAQ